MAQVEAVDRRAIAKFRQVFGDELIEDVQAGKVVARRLALAGGSRSILFWGHSGPIVACGASPYAQE